MLHFSLYLLILKHTEMSINAYTLKTIADWQLLFSSFDTDQSLFNGKQESCYSSFTMFVSQTIIFMKISLESY